VHRCVACMHGCGTCSSFTSKPPNRSQSFEEDHLQFAFSSKFRDESCAAQSPFLDRRKSGHIHPRQHASKHRYDRKPKVSKPPAPSHHRSPTLSQTVRRHGHGLRCTAQSPFLDSRKSVPSPSHANTCVQASVWPETRGKQTACNIAPPLTDTLADCAPPRARPHHRFSTVENRSRHHPTPTCVQASV